jgi:hypothetical protein
MEKAMEMQRVKLNRIVRNRQLPMGLKKAQTRVQTKEQMKMP